MILAGGLSTRLYPLTKQVPKPLVPIVGEPNAVHLIRYLAQYGIRDIAINVHYLAEAITRRLGDGSAFGVRLEYLHEDELLGSAGAVKQMEGYLCREPFVVVGCDDLTDLRLDQLLAFHYAQQAIATIGLVERESVEHYGVVVCDESGKIIGFQEKPAPGTQRSNLVNTGIYAFSPEIFTRMEPRAFLDFGKDVFPALQADGARFFGFDARDAYWCDIGTLQEYRRATRDVLEGRFALSGTRATGTEPSARISPDVRIDGAVRIGARVQIASGVSILGPSAIDDDVRIDANATIERSILWPGAHIGANARLCESIVGIEYAVAPQSVLDGAVVANDVVKA